jgi:hypothetical protein
MYIYSGLTCLANIGESIIRDRGACRKSQDILAVCDIARTLLGLHRPA